MPSSLLASSIPIRLPLPWALLSPLTRRDPFHHHLWLPTLLLRDVQEWGPHPGFSPSSSLSLLPICYYDGAQEAPIEPGPHLDQTFRHSLTHPWSGPQLCSFSYNVLDIYFSFQWIFHNFFHHFGFSISIFTLYWQAWNKFLKSSYHLDPVQYSLVSSIWYWCITLALTYLHLCCWPLFKILKYTI